MNRWFRDMPDQFKTKELCEKVVREEVEMFLDTPNDLRSQEMCNCVIMEGGGHWLFPDIIDKFLNVKMCKIAVGENPDMMLKFVPDRFKSQSMCNDVILKKPFTN